MRGLRVALVVVVVASLAACGGDDDDGGAVDDGNTETPSTTTTSAPDDPEPPTLDEARLDDPGVEIPIPDGARSDHTTRAGAGTATIKQPRGWTEFEDEDGWDVWGDDGSWAGHDNNDGSSYAYDPGQGLHLWDDSGHHQFIDDDGSGVDIPPPESGDGGSFPQDGGSPPTEPGGGGGGDPHYIRADGVWLSTQAAGEVVLRSGDAGHDVQARQEPRAGSTTVSVITAVATRIGDHRVGVYLEPEPHVVVDGEPLAIAGDFAQTDLAGGGAVGVWPEPRSVTDRGGRRLNLTPGVAIVWPDLGSVRVDIHETWLDVSTEWTTEGEAPGGLFGPLVGRDGVAVQDANDQAEITAFVDSWRVRGDESLFDYEPGESTDTFTIPGFPSGGDPTDGADLDEAEEACRAAGVEGDEAVDRCVFDLVATGDEGFVASHAAFSERLNGIAAVSQRLDLIAGLDGHGLELSQEDREAATAAVLDEDVDVTVEAGERATLSVDVPAAGAVSLINTELSCTDLAQPDTGGYQVFDERGGATSAAVAPCSEPTGEPFPAAGRYYVVLEGPASGDAVTFHLRFRDLSG